MTALFIIIGVVAVVAAVGMLLSRNSVYSALFLIVNFACVAFMYLMLDAAFLAMVQIAVYAGAIMVLFLFVIMLLGAEDSEVAAERDEGQFRLYTPVVLVLAVAFLLTLGVSVLVGDIDLLEEPLDPAQLRVAHMAPEAGAVNVYADGEAVLTDLRFREASEFISLAPGEHQLTITDEAGTPILELPLTLEASSVQTAVAYGAGAAPRLTVFADDVSSTGEDTGRVVVFNGTSRDIFIEDVGAEFNEEDQTTVLNAIPAGAPSYSFPVEEGTISTWRFAPTDAPEVTLFRLRDALEIDRDTLTLVGVVPNGPDVDRAQIVTVAAPTAFAFGSPQAVGVELFAEYALPMLAVSLVLLASLVGVIVVSQNNVTVAQPAPRPVRRRVVRPLASVVANQVGAGDTPQLPAGPAATDATQPVGD